MNTTTTITAYLADLSGPSSYRVTFHTPDGVLRSRTGTLTECTTYARTKAMERNVLVRFVDD